VPWRGAGECCQHVDAAKATAGKVKGFTDAVARQVDEKGLAEGREHRQQESAAEPASIVAQEGEQDQTDIKRAAFGGRGRE
jgi:hypothetical protein